MYAASNMYIEIPGTQVTVLKLETFCKEINIRGTKLHYINLCCMFPSRKKKEKNSTTHPGLYINLDNTLQVHDLSTTSNPYMPKTICVEGNVFILLSRHATDGSAYPDQVYVNSCYLLGHRDTHDTVSSSNLQLSFPQ